MEEPSIAVWIDPEDQTSKCQIRAQNMTPPQYGVILSTIIVHLGRLYGPGAETAAVEGILSGIKAGLEQRDKMDVPAGGQLH